MLQFEPVDVVSLPAPRPAKRPPLPLYVESFHVLAKGTPTAGPWNDAENIIFVAVALGLFA